MSKRHLNPEAGFTLIEAIIIMVVLAIVSAMMLPYFGSSITQSSAPIARLQSEGALNTVMEKITARYRQIPHWLPNHAYASAAIVIPTIQSGTGYKYKANNGGTSGLTEPAWPAFPSSTPANNTVNDNGITWAIDTTHDPVTGTATCAPTLSGSCSGCTYTCPAGFLSLIGAEGTDQTNTFGTYRVIQNHFITFNAANQEQASASATDYLKVTIGYATDQVNRTGETLTTLFVTR